MRQITKDAVSAFFAGDDFSRDNTLVVAPDRDRAYISLHGNLIAKRNGSEVYIRDAGWQSMTTKERLNGILARKGMHIYQKSGEWFLVHPIAPKEKAITPFDSLKDDSGWIRV